MNIDPFFIDGENETPLGRVYEVVAVFDAFGDAFGGEQLARPKGGDQLSHVFGRDVSIDGHRVRRRSDGKRQSVQSSGPTP